MASRIEPANTGRQARGPIWMPSGPANVMAVAITPRTISAAPGSVNRKSGAASSR